ncbi:SDR family oxidoreductase [bacterium]|nr:SDR family oxidoreductase [bacterium]
MRILITGVSGFIGGHLLAASPEQHEVWGTYLENKPSHDPARVLRVDLRNSVSTLAIVDGIKPDIIIHCAAHAKISFCESSPGVAWEMNSRVTADLAALCEEQEIRLVFMSSDMLFDGIKGQFSEADPPNPLNFYGWTKLGAERRIRDCDGNSVIVRVNLTYGAPLNGGYSFSAEVIDAVKAGKPYHLYADQFRSFISVKNLSQCIWELALSDFTGIIHLGGAEATNRVAFAHKLAERLRLDESLLLATTAEAAAPQIPYPKNNTFDLHLAQKLLKTPLLDLEEGLALEYPV